MAVPTYLRPRAVEAAGLGHHKPHLQQKKINKDVCLLFVVLETERHLNGWRLNRTWNKGSVNQ